LGGSQKKRGHLGEMSTGKAFILGGLTSWEILEKRENFSRGRRKGAQATFEKRGGGSPKMQ